MLDFIICDDIDVCKLRKLIEPAIIRRNLGTIALVTTNPKEVLDFAEKNENRAVYFLDVDLNNEIDGFFIAKRVREKDPYSYIIFVTAHMELSFVTYKHKLSVLDYIVKPISHADIANCLRAIQEYEENIEAIKSKELLKEDDPFITVKSGFSLHNIKIAEIIYIEVNKNKIAINIENETVSCFAAMREVRDKLAEKGIDYFAYCHKSFLINIKKIKQINSNTIIMVNGDICPLSRNYKKEIRDAAGC